MTVNNHRKVSRLRAARQAAGLSAERLAVLAGISSSIVYRSELAPNLMTERTCRAVAKVLQLDPEELRP